MPNEMLPSVVLLILMMFGGGAVAIAVARRLRRVLSFRVLVIVSYLIVNVASGIAHIRDYSKTRRGYFDAVARLEPGQLLDLILITAIGLIALCVGVLMGLPRSNPATPAYGKVVSPRDRAMLPAVIAILLPVSLWALFRIQAYAATLDTRRVISVSDGMARYFFLSMWLAPAVYFTVVWLASRLTSEQVFWKALLLFAGVVAIAASVQWTGGRSLAFLLSFPLILVMVPQLRRAKGFVIFFGGIMILLLIVNAVRQSEYRRSTSLLGNTGLSEWVDWEYGRFSLLGFAVQYVDKYGMLLGETIASGVWTSVEIIPRLLGMSHSDIDLRPSVQIMGEGLLNSESTIHIVPGLSAELFLNFGIAGIVLGYVILGRVCGWVDERFNNSCSMLTGLFWAYFGTMLAFNTIVSDSSTAISAITYRGTPLLVVGVASYLINRRKQRSTSQVGPRADSSNGKASDHHHPRQRGAAQLAGAGETGES